MPNKRQLHTRLSKQAKHLFWFDIELTYEELTFLNEQAEKMKLSHMDYLAYLLRKEKEVKQ